MNATARDSILIPVPGEDAVVAWEGGSASGPGRPRYREGCANPPGQGERTPPRHRSRPRGAKPRVPRTEPRLRGRPQSLSSGCPARPACLPGPPAAREKWKRKREGSFLFAAKLSDKVSAVGRGRERHAERQDPHRLKDSAADAQKAQAHLPAALRPVQKRPPCPAPARAPRAGRSREVML